MRRPISGGVVVFACALAGVACRSSAVGQFEATGPVTGNWKLRADRCLSGFHHGFRGVDLYRQDENDPTEVAIVADFGDTKVLTRVPHQDDMIVFRQADCRVLATDVHFNGVETNGIPGMSGSVKLDCDKPGVGHVSGEATFDCY